jgi:pimeloyl-ACP methyl ester carboxylesterase
MTLAADAMRLGSGLTRPRPEVTARLAREWWSTRRPDDWPAPPQGDGRPALLVPGFLAGDASLVRMAAWLRSGDVRTYRSGIALNVDCLEPMVARLEIRADDIAQRTGRRLIIIGQSRGGTLGRVLAVRRPDLVDTLVTLGSPVRDQLAITPRTELAVRAVSTLGTLGVPGLFSRRCRSGPCCARARSQVQRPFPPGVRFLALWSERDEVVRPAACLDPAAEQIEVGTTHVGMGLDAGVWRALAVRL